jgi:hypothetical protein
MLKGVNKVSVNGVSHFKCCVRDDVREKSSRFVLPCPIC